VNRQRAGADAGASFRFVRSIPGVDRERDGSFGSVVRASFASVVRASSPIPSVDPS